MYRQCFVVLCTEFNLDAKKKSTALLVGAVRTPCSTNGTTVLKVLHRKFRPLRRRGWCSRYANKIRSRGHPDHTPACRGSKPCSSLNFRSRPYTIHQKTSRLFWSSRLTSLLEYCSRYSPTLQGTPGGTERWFVRSRVLRRFLMQETSFPVPGNSAASL